MRLEHKKTHEVYEGEELFLERGSHSGPETYVYLKTYPERLLIIDGDVDDEEAMKRFREKYDVLEK